MIMKPVFNKEEQEAMRQMLKVFAKIQEEQDIDVEDYKSRFGRAFNNAMNSLIDFMNLSDETEKIVIECGY